jgi:hypothetical protein
MTDLSPVASKLLKGLAGPLTIIAAATLNTVICSFSCRYPSDPRVGHSRTSQV